MKTNPQKHQPTPRALDAGDPAAFSSIFLASSFFYSQAESTLAHLQITPAVGLFLYPNNKINFQDRTNIKTLKFPAFEILFSFPQFDLDTSK